MRLAPRRRRFVDTEPTSVCADDIADIEPSHAELVRTSMWTMPLLPEQADQRMLQQHTLVSKHFNYAMTFTRRVTTTCGATQLAREQGYESYGTDKVCCTQSARAQATCFMTASASYPRTTFLLSGSLVSASPRECGADAVGGWDSQPVMADTIIREPDGGSTRGCGAGS
ncbi:uncharacterized protein LAJ45_02051 [Morchella importuna]|uniref:uncharacterized protein n=1 Tax=Morchella importuna TaxID=1174673 RepID=UPI001E8DEB7B|nr:uncharacterized protein LAJ45_02051 [Morchella importuna]KAH8154283.1 hypothetical protein LAJ45_02051 [Morchella importuna]